MESKDKLFVIKTTNPVTFSIMTYKGNKPIISVGSDKTCDLMLSLPSIAPIHLIVDYSTRKVKAIGNDIHCDTMPIPPDNSMAFTNKSLLSIHNIFMMFLCVENDEYSRKELEECDEKLKMAATKYEHYSPYLKIAHSNDHKIFNNVSELQRSSNLNKEEINKMYEKEVGEFSQIPPLSGVENSTPVFPIGSADVVVKRVEEAFENQFETPATASAVVAVINSQIEDVEESIHRAIDGVADIGVVREPLVDLGRSAIDNEILHDAIKEVENREHKAGVVKDTINKGNQMLHNSNLPEESGILDNTPILNNSPLKTIPNGFNHNNNQPPLLHNIYEQPTTLIGTVTTSSDDSAKFTEERNKVLEAEIKSIEDLKTSITDNVKEEFRSAISAIVQEETKDQVEKEVEKCFNEAKFSQFVSETVAEKTKVAMEEVKKQIEVLEESQDHSNLLANQPKVGSNTENTEDKTVEDNTADDIDHKSKTTDKDVAIVKEVNSEIKELNPLSINQTNKKDEFNLKIIPDNQNSFNKKQQNFQPMEDNLSNKEKRTIKQEGNSPKKSRKDPSKQVVKQQEENKKAVEVLPVKESTIDETKNETTSETGDIKDHNSTTVLKKDRSREQVNTGKVKKQKLNEDENLSPHKQENDVLNTKKDDNVDPKPKVTSSKSKKEASKVVEEAADLKANEEPDEADTKSGKQTAIPSSKDNEEEVEVASTKVKKEESKSSKSGAKSKKGEKKDIDDLPLPAKEDAKDVEKPKKGESKDLKSAEKEPTSMPKTRKSVLKEAEEAKKNKNAETVATSKKVTSKEQSKKQDTLSKLEEVKAKKQESPKAEKKNSKNNGKGKKDEQTEKTGIEEDDKVSASAKKSKTPVEAVGRQSQRNKGKPLTKKVVSEEQESSSHEEETKPEPKKTPAKGQPVKKAAQAKAKKITKKK